MKSIYAISTFSRPTNSRLSWEFDVAGVEYLFIGDGGHITEGDHDFRYTSINGLNAKPQRDARSGRYR